MRTINATLAEFLRVLASYNNYHYDAHATDRTLLHSITQGADHTVMVIIYVYSYVAHINESLSFFQLLLHAPQQGPLFALLHRCILQSCAQSL